MKIRVDHVKVIASSPHYVPIPNGWFRRFLRLNTRYRNTGLVNVSAWLTVNHLPPLNSVISNHWFAYRVLAKDLTKNKKVIFVESTGPVRDLPEIGHYEVIATPYREGR